MDKKDLSDFIESFSNGIKNERMEMFLRVVGESGIEKYNSFEEFYFGVIYDTEQCIESYVRHSISDNDDVVFLYCNSQFIQRHFEKVIKMKEGWACSADKSRTMINALISFFTTKKEIVFNYDGEYTYHLPSVVFKDHESILQFYKSIKNMYWGDPELYIAELTKLVVEKD